MRKILLLAVLTIGLFCSWQVALAQKTITGKVTDDKDGTSMPGVTVLVQGTTIGAATDGLGAYKISVPAKGTTLVFSMIGFNSKSVTIGNQTTINVKLQATTAQLGEVVVTGMGISRESKALGYATTTIKSNTLVETASTNFASALYGKAPGLRIATAPGGSTSGVSIQIRGLNSLTQNTQPLIVMDGIPIRNGSFDNSNYWGDQRIRSNGLTDLNPEDIDNITILKGASAAALYGSDATNGVILITSKSGHGKKGFSVDVSTQFFQDEVAYLPRLQNVRGAGSPVQYDVYGEDANGFNQNKSNLNGTDYRTLVQGSLNFGPKFDGQPILSWDGVVRPYSAQKNGWANLFQKSNNQVENISISNVSDNANTRLSVTHANYQGLSINSSNEKFTVNLNSTQNFGKKFRMNFIVDEIFSNVLNRPYMDDRLINNFGGMLPAFDNGSWYKEKYKTSMGYKYVTGSNQSLTPNENLRIPNYRTDVLDFMWNVNENRTNEHNNRLFASVTNFWDITKNFQLRGRIGTDWTSNREEDKSSSSQPLVYGPSGSYGLNNYAYSILYGDLLLTYSKKINDNFEVKAMGGYTGDKESMYRDNVSTNGGLTTENRFDLTSSANPNYYSGISRSYMTKDAFLATANVSYKNFLFAEGTFRRDRTSTMNPKNNAFWYPSVNGSIILSEALKLPTFINYAKFRGSWGIVGNYPSQYQANVAYSLGNLGNQGAGSSTLTSTVPTGTFGNDGIRPEKKHEFEFGLETKFLQSRIGMDITYYKAKIVDMILPLSIAQSTGASSILTNVGTMQNSGLEIALNGTPIQTPDFNWNTGINFSFNNNKILSLTTNSDRLYSVNGADGDAYSILSQVGRAAGDFYAHPIKTDAQGNKMITDYGNGEFNYTIDNGEMKRYGNATVKAVGGFYNSFKYKAFTLDVVTDFRIGGYVMPSGLFWMTSRGLTKESLTAMDAEHGGVSYYKDGNGRGVETAAATGPTGQTVYHDGIKMGGVFADGTPNTYVTSQFYYYWDMWNWGGPQYGNSQYFRYIVENSYWKMREVSLSYTLPKFISSKIGSSKVTLSVFGRNLFYLYRTIKDMDAEQLTAGTSWSSQLQNAGNNPSSRTFGFSLRASF